MKVRDRISAFCTVLFSLFVMWQSWVLGLGTLYVPDAGFLPFLSGLTLSVLSLLLFLSSFWFPRKTAAKETEVAFDKKQLFRPLLVVVSLFFFAIFLNVLGFILSTLIFLVFLLRTVEPLKWRLVLTIAVSVSIVAYGLFDTLLKTQLPRGFLTF
jgi:putative tricarboxylic transport membrane protein